MCPFSTPLNSLSNNLLISLRTELPHRMSQQRCLLFRNSASPPYRGRNMCHNLRCKPICAIVQDRCKLWCSRLMALPRLHRHFLLGNMPLMYKFRYRLSLRVSEPPPPMKSYQFQLVPVLLHLLSALLFA